MNALVLVHFSGDLVDHKVRSNSPKLIDRIIVLTSDLTREYSSLSITTISAFAKRNTRWSIFGLYSFYIQAFCDIVIVWLPWNIIICENRYDVWQELKVRNLLLVNVHRCTIFQQPWVSCFTSVHIYSKLTTHSKLSLLMYLIVWKELQLYCSDFQTIMKLIFNCI